MKIELTESQCRNVADFIHWNIFDIIRNDSDIDNPNWLLDMMDAWQKLDKAGEKVGVE
jgi:hypothetical protein